MYNRPLKESNESVVPEYLGENTAIECRIGECTCGNIVRSYQKYCDECGIRLEWRDVNVGNMAQKGTEKSLRLFPGGKIVEAREFRCCMCPQTNDKSRICPVGPGKPEETLCDFTVILTDARGWKYKVMGDLAGTFKGRYQDDKHNGDTGWKGMRQMERRKTFDQAQEDLNRYAKQKGWKLAGEMG